MEQRPGVDGISNTVHPGPSVAVGSCTCGPDLAWTERPVRDSVVLLVNLASGWRALERRRAKVEAAGAGRREHDFCARGGVARARSPRRESRTHLGMGESVRRGEEASTSRTATCRARRRPRSGTWSPYRAPELFGGGGGGGGGGGERRRVVSLGNGDCYLAPDMA